MPDRPRSANVSVSAREADADQLFSERLMLIYIGARKSNVDADIASLRPSKPLD